MTRNSRLYIDGKAVLAWLFAHRIRSLDGRSHLEFVQVEAFNLDHAVKRLIAAYPSTSRRDWEMLEPLDPEHDVGALGRKLPLLPEVIGNGVRH